MTSVGFVAARNCMRQQVLDDANSLPNYSRTTLYYKVLLQY